jgi:phosphopantetheine--protein transferase-like protein
MYSRHRMFHGPRFQGVVGLERIGDDGLVATLEVLPMHNLFSGRDAAHFAFDPFLLDAAGQLVGYWPVEYLDEGYVLFPIRLQELTRYGEEPPVGSRVRCNLRVKHVAFRELHADLDLIGPDGKLWMRLSGWQDWRFHWPQSFYDFWRFPNDGIAGAEIKMTLPPHAGDVEIRRMVSEGELKSVLWEKLWAYLICSRHELARFREMPANPRRTEWMAGRSAVKDAVRVWLKKRFARDLYPADVEIVPDDSGRPTVAGPCVQAVAQLPFISIAHKGVVGIGAAGSKPLGIDLETIEPRDEAFAATAFSGEERRMIALAANGASDEWLTRAWAAKESAGKAAGHGLSAGPLALVIERIDAATGLFIVNVTSGAEDNRPRRFTATTQRDADFVIALAIEEEHGHANA